MDGEASFPRQRQLYKLSSLGRGCGRGFARKREDVGVDEGVSVGVDEVDIPFELVGKVASAGAVAKAGHVESGATARHDEGVKMTLLSDWGRGTDEAVPKSLGEEMIDGECACW